ncbi:MAG TPA: D-glycero-beta-D-manno-heptose 1,7-bisphosphate 7-phosphatase [Steroidobacteraceae bacterium]|nr:D-glycero-beta-D-manno-heptose 1,7-bisphosphate 7-phosphatase [Steroidobacteraceae bacterium]
MRVRHVIVDRDGVLNRESPDGGYVMQPGDFHWLPGALAGLAALHQAGIRISVATNQAGVGRGVMRLEQLQAVHERMQAEAAAAGGTLAAVLFCPHSPEEHCECRKPAAGLIRSAIADSDIAAAETLMVGDDERDLEAARRAGVRAVLVRTGKGRAAEAQLRDIEVAVYDDLAQLAHAIVAEQA